LRAAIEAVDAARLVRTALREPATAEALAHASFVDVIAAGKAASQMLAAFLEDVHRPVRMRLGVGPHRTAGHPLTPDTTWIDAGHPLPNEGSVAGARRALAIASAAGPGDLLIVLLSGGGSALMAMPAPGIALDDKQHTARTLMNAGADIYELNTVRKHLSAIKGGQLAAASPGAVLTLAISDVVGDDLSVIASGPTVPDNSTYGEALAVLARRGGSDRYPAAVVRRLRDGADGRVPDTPATGDSRMARAMARVIGAQRGAVDGARVAAESLGYHVWIVDAPITGEARLAAPAHVARVASQVPSGRRPLCVIACGETTVTVSGTGKGGRNQEFALAMAGSLASLGTRVAAASIGTDGIDGPTDAAGAIVDSSTFERARQAGIADPDCYLIDNNTYAFFDRLGDLIRTGPTGTNVGDVQVILVA
jgi:hydroxypyruvate reductase